MMGQIGLGIEITRITATVKLLIREDTKEHRRMQESREEEEKPRENIRNYRRIRENTEEIKKIEKNTRYVYT